MKNRRSASSSQAAQGDLIDRIGPDRVWIGAPARQRCGSVEGVEPLALVRPANAEQVALIIKIGRARHVPVVVCSSFPLLNPQSARDVIVLDARGLDRPPAMDISRRIVTVGAGVSVHAVDKAARQARLCLRGVPGTRGPETVGSMIAAGVSGAIGLGDGSLLSDVVSLNIVAGNGRSTRLGHAAIMASVPWRCEGLPDAASQLVGAAGRLGVLCEVTLRLHPAPWVAWSQLSLEGDRRELLSLLSASRLAISRRVVDTVMIEEGRQALVRASTWRGEDDLEATTELASTCFARHGVSLGPWEVEDRRVRLGSVEGPWPKDTGERALVMEVRSSWPDAVKVLDVSDALIASQGHDAPVSQVRRTWAMSSDFVRMRHHFEGEGPHRHPLISGVRYLLDAGAVPVALEGPMRGIAKERMDSGTKVLLAGLTRAWDPDGVLGDPPGLL